MIVASVNRWTLRRVSGSGRAGTLFATKWVKVETFYPFRVRRTVNASTRAT